MKLVIFILFSIFAALMMFVMKKIEPSNWFYKYYVILIVIIFGFYLIAL